MRKECQKNVRWALDGFGPARDGPLPHVPAPPTLRTSPHALQACQHPPAPACSPSRGRSRDLPSAGHFSAMLIFTPWLPLPPTGFTSSLVGLPDQVLLTHTRSLVLHEQALQLAVLDHLREIQARHLHLRLGFSSLFDYAVHELGYSEGAAWRRIKAMRLCSETAGTRERLQDGSLTLSAAAQVQNTFDLLQRTATAAADPGSPPATPELLPGGTGTTPGGWGCPRAEASGASATGAGATAASAGCGAAAGAGGAGERQEHARGEAVVGRGGSRTGAAGRSHAGAGRGPLGAEGGDRLCNCQCGIEQLRALLSHVDPHLTRGATGGAAGAGRPAALRPGAAAARAQRVGAGRQSRARRRSRRRRKRRRAGRLRRRSGTRKSNPECRRRRRARAPVAAPPAPAALSAEEGARGNGGAGTSAVAALSAPPSGRETCGASTPVRAKPAAPAPRTAASAPKSVADRGSHATVPTPRRTPPADQSRPTALAAADRGRNAPSPAKRAGAAKQAGAAKRAGAAQPDGRSRPQAAAAGASGGSAQPPHRARRSRYIPAAVRREVWRRDGGCCSYVDPHSGRRCGSRFLLQLDHIVPFALGGSAEPGNLRVHCAAHNRFRHREYGPPTDGAT